MPKPRKSLVPATIEAAILHTRGQNVMLDSDLAALYGVPTKVLNQAVRRNAGRFPQDFMSRLTAHEAKFLRSHIVTLKTGSGAHRKYRPCAFTEQGIAGLSAVLRSPRAIRVHVEIMRAFVHLRRIVTSNVELSRRIDELEKRYDARFKVVFQAVREAMAPPVS